MTELDVFKFGVCGVSIRIEQLGAADIQCMDISGLVVYSRYRGIKSLEKDDHEKIFRADNAAAVNAGGICAAVFSGDRLQAVCAIAPLEWDSQHFGMPMANLVIAAVSGCASAVLLALLEKTVDAAKKTLGVIHVSADLDIDDYGCLNALLALGFEILDIKRAYRCSGMTGVRVPKLRSLVRDYCPEDRERVLWLARNSEINSRFSRDPFLSRHKVEALYQLWFEKLLGSNGDNAIALVFERSGQVEACGVIGATDLSYAGVSSQFMDKGLYISGSDGVGGYFPVLYELISRSLLRYDLAQTSASLNNHAAVRVLERMHVGSESIRYALRLYRP
jgi:RimJ/RimL family protein N-acetyltransferase